MTAVDNGHIPLALFLDLTKAFDSVDHTILLEKLENYGIRNNQLKLMKSYLQNRKQKILLKTNEYTCTSKELEVSMGVTQGSILGPLLFIVYINDLPEICSEKIQPSVKGPCETYATIYADDTNIVITAEEPQTTISRADTILGEVEKWCRVDILRCNEKPCSEEYNKHSVHSHFPVCHVIWNNILGK